MKPLTPETALEETIKLWKRIKREKLESKPDTRFYLDCPCCHYVAQKAYWIRLANGCTKHCPMFPHDEPYMCEMRYDGNPYFEYTIGTIGSKYAYGIADGMIELAERKLNELKTMEK